MNPESFEPVNVRLYDCESGGIHLDVSVASQTVKIYLSEVFDPFPNFLCWMEAILTNVMECSFEIDEDGPTKNLVAIRRWDERLLFRIRDCENNDLLQAVVHRRQLIEALYHGVQLFAASNEYKPEEWERETLGERFLKLDNVPNIEFLLETLLRRTRKELQQLFYNIAPAQMYGYPAAPNSDEAYARIVDHIFDPTDPQKAQGVTLTPIEWLDEMYDIWPTHQKREHLFEILTQNKVSRWDGMKLEQFRSSRIDQFLHPIPG